MSKVLTLSSIFLVSASHFIIHYDAYWPAWMMVYTFMAVYTSWIVADKIHWSAGVVTGSHLLSSIWVFANRDNIYSNIEPLTKVSLHSISAQSGFAFLIMGFVLMNIKKCRFLDIFDGLHLLLIVHSTMIIGEHIFGAIQLAPAGLMANTSMAATLCGILFPLVLNEMVSRRTVLSVIYAVLPVVAIWLCESSMGYLTLMAGTGIYLFGHTLKASPMTSHMLKWLLPTVAAFGLGHYFVGSTYFASIDRFEAWPMFMKWWFANASELTGTGNDSFMVFGPYIQTINNFEIGQWWIWMHSDWLQLLFEQGIAGLSCVMVMVYCLLKRLFQYGEWLYLAIVSSYCVAAIGNYPTQVGLTGFIGMALVIYGFKSTNKEGFS